VLSALLGVSLSGTVGLVGLHRQLNAIVQDSSLTKQQDVDLELALHRVNEASLRLLVTTDGREQARLAQSLDETLVPDVERRISVVGSLMHDDAGAPQRLARISGDFDSYLALRRSGAFEPTNDKSDEQAAAAQATLLFGRMLDEAEGLRAIESLVAERADASGLETYRTTLRLVVGGSVAALLIGLTVVLLLIRSVVPRIRQYSQFAAAIARGQDAAQLSVRGRDELTDLGNALNDMVAARDRLTSYESAQTEFIETLQATATEEEAHGLLKRHLERSLPGSGVTVLTRNNSNNRLEAATAPREGDPVTARLVGTEPRACLALRMGRTHREGDDNQLLECQVCQHGAAARSTCEPLLVGGEVIGSVLVNHEERLAGQQDGRIALTVAQAAPVLANLRNLALAEFRANNDSLTGLPNKRATEDTFKRMIAQAHRSVAPLAVVMLDLDHFKRVNDQFGHGKGDEVLAAVGAAIQAVLRESDFAGRFGGEEFLLLLPDTGVEGAARLAERLRESIAEITVPGIEREITASLGLAELLEHGGTPRGLLREADRALYAAKAAGRNRSVVARVTDSGDVVHTEVAVLAASLDGAATDGAAALT
jgi:diguanylate cyclase (GGDEF)-like protein